MANDDTKLIEDTELAWPAIVTRQSRRDFLGLTITAATGAALWSLFPSIAEAQAGSSCVAVTGEALMNPGEIVSIDKVLRGVIDLRVETRGITYYNNGIFVCDQHTLRSYRGFQGWTLDESKQVQPRIKPPAKSSAKNAKPPVVGAAPGPTLRVGVGERVELIFLNRIDQSQFARSSVTSSFGKCDESFNVTGGQIYPGTPNEKFPNCFHASNTSNLHFHGTHTSPGGFGDNVLIGVIPNPKMNVAAALGMCERAYADWGAGQDPTKWLQESAAVTLRVLLKAAKDAGNTELVAQIQSGIDVNEIDRKNGEWPQYWPGVYPHYFDLPIWSGDLTKFPRMGQSPGTHWYHCHQHGSTTLQILNGMAGLVIITGDYDKEMLSIGGGTPEKPKIKEQIMILQLFAEQPNQINPNASSATVAVNGQVMPTVTMKKNEVQWWRIADAAMKAHGIESYLFVNDAVWKNPGTLKNGFPPIATVPTPLLYQTAQDGVQYAWDNFQRHSKLTSFSLSPGNRADFLVQAPAQEGVFYMVFWPPAGTPPPPVTSIVAQTFLKVIVSGDAGSDVLTTLPTQDEYPKFPDFLADITDAEINGRHNTVTFSMTGGPGGPPNQPQFYIDGQQFAEGRIDQLMLLDTAEEWTLVNTSKKNIAHPFHIHINPFQITEVYNPQTMPNGPQKQPFPHYTWGDVIAIPASYPVPTLDANGKPVLDSNGNPVTVVKPGHIKIRSRFVDFPGKFVLHCHILGHEDRGMMQLVEVLDNKTVVKHH